jgi:hypothetical protein
MRWGPLAHGLLLMPVEAVEAQGLANRVLALDTRVRPLAGEPVWLPMGDGAAEWGFQPVQGTVVSTQPDAVLVRLQQPLPQQAQLGTPVLSRLTGRVIGLVTTWAGSEDQGMTLRLTPTSLLRQALATPPQEGTFQEVPSQQPTVPEATLSGRWWLGVALQELTPALRQGFQVPLALQGVVVANVVTDAPAHRAGMVQGDIIVAFQAEPVAEKDAFQHIVQKIL